MVVFSPASPPAKKSFYSLSHPDSRGEPFPFSSLAGKVVLLVNTASGCGFTPQYTSLETLYQKFSTTHPDQFLVLGFPSNQFLGQEPLSDAEIQTFCTRNHGVTFPVLAKSDVNGPHENEVWNWLKEQRPGLWGLKRVKWNFEKFMVGRDGQVVGRWSSRTSPQSLEELILKELEKPAPKETHTDNGKAVVEDGMKNDHPKPSNLETAQNDIHRSEL